MGWDEKMRDSLYAWRAAAELLYDVLCNAYEKDGVMVRPGDYVRTEDWELIGKAMDKTEHAIAYVLGGHSSSP